MKQIPDCPQGMGNANDWMKERERRGFPQNRTVSYEHTEYHSNDAEIDRILAGMKANYEKIAELRYQEGKREGYEEGYQNGYHDGYEDSIEDVRDCLRSNFTEQGVKTALEADPPFNVTVEYRYKNLLPAFKEINRLILSGVKPNLDNLRKLCSN